MKSIKVNPYLFLMILSGIFFQSCSKDESVFEDIDDGITGQLTSEKVSNLDNTVVTTWAELLLELDTYATGMRPNASARALAYIYLAAYETAAPGMFGFRSNAQRLNGLSFRDEEFESNLDWEVALNKTFAVVFDHFLINLPSDKRALIQALEAELEEVYSSNLSEIVINDSKLWGTYVATQVIEYSQTDEEAEAQILESQPFSYEPPTGDGFWTYSADQERALFPYWGTVRTFVISPDETNTIAPISYNETPGTPYFTQMMEVYTVNNTAKEEDNDDLWIAEFWSDDVENLMFGPPVRQVSIATQLTQQADLNLEETLVLFLKLGFALNDAAVSTWKYKYQYMVMRPNVFIQDFIDPSFQTNLYRLIYWPNPSFPGYPSGHSCFASAAGGVFIEAFGNQINFTDRSHEGATAFRGQARSFSSLKEMIEENAYSRIPLGVHIRMDCDEGIRLGYEISEAVNDFKLKHNL